MIDEKLDGCKMVFITPSHQFPTNVTMSAARRRQLLAWAEQNNSLIIEDDYEFETNYTGDPTPALKSRDREGRVHLYRQPVKIPDAGSSHGLCRCPRALDQPNCARCAA